MSDNQVENGGPKHYEDPSVRPATIGEKGRRIWMYPIRRGGPRASLRRNTAIGLMIFYLVAPFLSINDRPLIRFDVLQGRADLFGLVFHNNDAAYIVFVLLALSLILFLVTAVRGRLWCGYACPQTVFIDWLLRPIEELIEGGAHQRRLRDQGPKNLNYFLRKIAKHSIFLVIAAIVANAFLAYFIPPTTLWQWILSPPSEHPTAFGFMMFVLLAFYADLGWFREQFCAFLCPYARFQSVMIDRDTPAVAYDVQRGEPRAKAAERKVAQGAVGDCIDCGLCVRVCPTGIDIRNGLQLECIACERCIDACDSIMRSVKKPEGLIRIASLREIERDPSARSARVRVIIYSVMLGITIIGAIALLFNRRDVGLTIVRAPRTAFIKMPDGRLNNMFVIQVTNHRDQEVSLDFELVAPTDAQVICGACSSTLAAGREANLNVTVLFRPTPGHRLDFVLRHKVTEGLVEAPLMQP